MLRLPKTNILADGLMERTSSMLDGIESKAYIKKKKVINKGKRSKTLSKVKPVKNINKSPQSFLEISTIQKEVLLSHKLQGHIYE